MTPADLEAWQQRLGFSQVAAARALAVHVQTYRNWLAERRTIPPIAERLCAYVERFGTLADDAEPAQPDETVQADPAP